MLTFGLPQFVEALEGQANPRYGAAEDAAWNRHRAQVMAHAFGHPMESMSERQLRAWRALESLCKRRPQHPFSRALESGYLIRKFEEQLGPVDFAYGQLMDVRNREMLRLAQQIFGEVVPVENVALLKSGLDDSLSPRWEEIFDRL